MLEHFALFKHQPAALPVNGFIVTILQGVSSLTQRKDSVPIRIERRVDQVLLLATSALEMNFPSGKVVKNGELAVPVMVSRFRSC